MVKARNDSGLRAEADTAWLWGGLGHQLADGFDIRTVLPTTSSF
jgi:hypothetical protein